ncbi:MAG: hypothetical protein KF785_09245 [Gemmatimonadales bacterium]|nr:hypothetical protein [Gemmatimonadales bacterium]
MPATSLAYRAAARAAVALLPLIRGAAPKLRIGDLARRGAVARWEAWSQAARDRRRPLLWIHAPSVGEGLQAEAVLALLREAHPDWQIVYSFFSPSAEALARRQPVDCADYLPYDTRTQVDAMLSALEPTALVFTKLDLWPELATRARRRGTRVGLVAGTVSPVSGRRRPVARALTRPGYAAIDRAGAIAPDDARRLVELGTDPTRITVLGDPRVDSAFAKVAALPDSWPLAHLTEGAATLVAGSTWEGDEQVVVDAWRTVQSKHSNARLILVPHEPVATHLRALTARLAASGLRGTRLSELPDRGVVPRLVIVDRVGILAGLYRGAAMAYVGGGFGRAGLHSVLEPAVCAIPIVVGPRWQTSREAGLLIDARAAVALVADPTEAASQLAACWSGWLADPVARVAAGNAALRVAEGERGAARRNADLVATLMAGSPPR